MKKGDIVKIKEEQSYRQWYTADYYIVIKTLVSNPDLLEIKNLNNNKIDIIHHYYLKDVKLDYRKKQIQKIKDIIHG